MGISYNPQPQADIHHQTWKSGKLPAPGQTAEAILQLIHVSSVDRGRAGVVLVTLLMISRVLCFLSFVGFFFLLCLCNILLRVKMRLYLYPVFLLCLCNILLRVKMRLYLYPVDTDIHPVLTNAANGLKVPAGKGHQQTGIQITYQNT